MRTSRSPELDDAEGLGVFFAGEGWEPGLPAAVGSRSGDADGPGVSGAGGSGGEFGEGDGHFDSPASGVGGDRDVQFRVPAGVCT